MRFYDQYEKIRNKKGIEPCSQLAAEMFGVTRATISQWNSRDKVAKGETVRIIADALGVSADYLLGRTNNPTDYTNPNTAANKDETIPDLTPEEQYLLDVYRRADDRGKRSILRQAHSEDQEAGPQTSGTGFAHIVS
ncbi:MAG: helix-turn-helix domain-containing protein [Acetatifactor sp.]|nr:helix-turn-helix domain-containing protein [Acetatifactor sp.]